MLSTEGFEKYVNDSSSKINGWFFPPDMAGFFLIDLAQQSMGLSGDLCEVGVWQGKSLVLSSLFLKPGEMLYGFDLYPENYKDVTSENLRNYGNPANVHLLTCDTSQVTHEELRATFSKGIRTLHIDAGHEYHEVFHQLILFAPFVARAGCIIMDDYQDREFPGIEAAVLDFCDIDRPRRFVPFFAGANKMFLCEIEHAATYQRLLMSHDIVRQQSRLTRVRDFNILVGFSKLPVAPEATLNLINSLGHPLPYSANEAGLSRLAAQYDQNHFGSGKARE